MQNLISSRLKADQTPRLVQKRGAFILEVFKLDGGLPVIPSQGGRYATCCLAAAGF